MAVREKRSISLPPDVAAAIDAAAEISGSSVSAWITETVVHRLRLDAGRAAIAEWEREHGALTADELADGLARARALLAPDPVPPGPA
jgi:predicted transcriptional regulator